MKVTQETIGGRCVFVTRDDHYKVVRLSVANHGWDEYEGAEAQRAYDRMTAPYRMACYND